MIMLAQRRIHGSELRVGWDGRTRYRSSDYVRAFVCFDSRWQAVVIWVVD